MGSSVSPFILIDKKYVLNKTRHVCGHGIYNFEFLIYYYDFLNGENSTVCICFVIYLSFSDYGPALLYKYTELHNIL